MTQEQIIQMQKCTKCIYREECNNCDQELTCEEFLQKMKSEVKRG